MTWTYGGDPAANSRDEVRWLCGDTETVDQLITDEEIAHALTLAGSTQMASVLCLETLANKYSRDVDNKLSKASESSSQRAKAFRESASALRRNLLTALPSISIGGLTLSGKRELREDRDAVQPAFARGSFDNQRAADNITQPESGGAPSGTDGTDTRDGSEIEVGDPTDGDYLDGRQTILHTDSIADSVDTLNVGLKEVDDKNGTTILVGTPTDGDYLDGQVSIDPTDIIADAVDFINVGLKTVNDKSGTTILVGTPTDGDYLDGQVTIVPGDIIADAVDFLNVGLKNLNDSAFTGPGSSTDNAVVRFDGTGGKTVQDSGVTIDDSNQVIFPAKITANGELLSPSTGTNSFKAGSSAVAGGSASFALGVAADAGGDNSFALGRNTETPGNSAAAIGFQCIAGADCTVIGRDSRAGADALGVLGTGGASIVIGNASVIHEDVLSAIAVGPNITVPTGATDSICFGSASAVTGIEALALGARTSAANQAFAGGADAQALQQGTVAVGTGSKADGTGSFAGGRNCQTTGDFSVLVAPAVSIAVNQTTAFGYNARPQAILSSAFGYFANAVSSRSTAVGESSNAGGASAVALGSNAHADGSNSCATGRNANASGGLTVVSGAAATGTATGATSYGFDAQCDGSYSFSCGYSSRVSVSYTNCFAFGRDGTGTASNRATFGSVGRPMALEVTGGIGVFGTAPPAAQPSVTGSRNGNAALASLLTALASEGLIADNTTA